VRAAVALLAACASAPPPAAPSNRAVASQPDPCDMIETMLAIDSDGYRRIYDSCGDPKGKPRIVDVVGPESLIPPGLRCAGKKFVLLAQHPHADFLIVKLTLGPDGPPWSFSARAYQPVPNEVDDDAFEVTTSYCVATGGFIEWRDGRWRTWEDFDRIMRLPRR
jgi:hypothetical protein